MYWRSYHTSNMSPHASVNYLAQFWLHQPLVWFFLCHSIHVCITSRSDIVSIVSYTDWWYIVTVAFVIAVILLDIPTTNAHPTVANVVRLRCVCCSCSGSWCISFLIFFFLFLVFGAAIYVNKFQGCPGYQLGPEAKYNDRQHSG